MIKIATFENFQMDVPGKLLPKKCQNMMNNGVLLLQRFGSYLKEVMMLHLRI